MDAYSRMEIYADVDETNSADRFRKRFILGSHQRDFDSPRLTGGAEKGRFECRATSLQTHFGGSQG